MPDSIVARIADRLDIQPEQTERLLRTLAQLIKKQSAREGRVRGPGLGVFQKTADVLSFEGEAAAGGDPWRNRGGYELVRRPGALEIRWLPARTVRCRLVVPGYQEAWSEPVQLEEGAEATAPPVRFSRGREIRLRLEAPEGSQVPREVSIRVWKWGARSRTSLRKSTRSWAMK